MDCVSVSGRVCVQNQKKNGREKKKKKQSNFFFSRSGLRPPPPLHPSHTRTHTTPATMGERKVVQQYYPPDFDPSKLPRAKRADLNALKVRMMLPMSIRCGTCGNFMSKVGGGGGRRKGGRGRRLSHCDVWRTHAQHTHTLRLGLQGLCVACLPRRRAGEWEARQEDARAHFFVSPTTLPPQGTKFNTKKEDVAGETYLGIQVREKREREKRGSQHTHQKTSSTPPFPPSPQVLRFYMRCSACSAEITFKTDPGNSSYTVEQGATANWTPWQPGGGGEGGSGGPSSLVAPDAPPPTDADGDAMAALEARVAASKRELDLLDAVDELRARAAARAALAPDAALAALAAADGGDDDGGGDGNLDPDAEDEAAVARMLQARAERVTRLAEAGEPSSNPPPPPPPAAAPLPPPPLRTVKPAVVVVRKRAAAAGGEEGGAQKKAAPAPPADGGGLVGLVGDYGSSSQSE